MRPSPDRAFSALCAIVALALVAGSAMPGGAGAIEHGRIVRVGRGAPQRLDAADGIPHSHEVSEPDTTTTSQMVAGPPGAAPSRAARGGRAARADAVIARIGLPLASAATVVGLLLPAFPLPSATPLPAAPGRAPPTA